MAGEVNECVGGGWVGVGGEHTVSGGINRLSACTSTVGLKLHKHPHTV